MSGRHYYKHKRKEVDVDVTPLLNVMVVLIAFLILSAVFSRLSIQEIVLPGQSDGSATPDKPLLTIEVIVRRDLLELSDGTSVTATFPKLGAKYDLQKLSESLWRIKEKHSDKQDVSILLEPDIDYETMIQVMDAVKGAPIKKAGQENAQQVVLFPQVAIGDAP